FFSSRRRHTRSYGDWSSDVCSSDLSWLWTSAAFQPHVQRIAGAQVDLRLELDGPVGHVAEAIVARDLVQVHEHLVEGEGLADAKIGRASCRERVERTGVELT